MFSPPFLVKKVFALFCYYSSKKTLLMIDRFKLKTQLSQ